MKGVLGCPVLLAGSLGDAGRSLLRQAVPETGLSINAVESPGDVVEWMRENETSAMLIDADCETSRRAAMSVRTEAAYASVPIVGFSARPDDLGFADMFSWGGDDLVGTSAVWPLVHRLRAVRREPGSTVPVARIGRVLIGDAEVSRRLAIARVVHNAGFDVSFSVERAELLSRVAQDDPDLVVCGLDVAPDPAVMIREVRAKGLNALWIVLAPPRQATEVHRQVDGLAGVAVTDAFAPPENVQFLLNELRNPVGQGRRASKRLLYGTTVFFRGAGREEDDRGFCFNVSEGGLYVRTLAPPLDDLVWLEITPPRSERRVRLVGKVAWRRWFGPNERATVPPGFGVAIVDGAQRDLQAWTDGYGAFLNALG